MIKTASIIFCLLLVSFIAEAKLCNSWSEPLAIGSLDKKLLPEASGLSVSRKYPNRFYHHNDSGDGPFFYVSNEAGQELKKIEVPGMIPTDVEDISVGSCESETCIFLADIGDNSKDRKNIELWILKEVEVFGPTAQVWKHIYLNYPDGPHNAEALAVHPLSGDVYIVTKEYQRLDAAQPARVFRIQKQKLLKATSGESIILEDLGEIDIPFLNKTYDLFGQIITAMDFRPDGENLLLLTYENVIEVRASLLEHLDSKDWKHGHDYQVIPLSKTRQYEALSYSADGTGFYFDSEFDPEEEAEVPLYKITCE